MQNPPFTLLQTVATLLAALAFVILVSMIGLWQWMPQQSGSGSTTPTLEASSGPVYDEQKALAAGLEQSPAGKQLFVNNCRQCHAINDVVVGPALANVSTRRNSEWLHDFIRNSSKMIQNGDPVAKSLFEEYNRTQMPSFNFSEEEIESLLTYIKFETAAYGL